MIWPSCSICELHFYDLSAAILNLLGDVCEESEDLSNEGRIIATDHGQFVLINIYAPALTSEENFEERVDFKMKWYKVQHQLYCSTCIFSPLWTMPIMIAAKDLDVWKTHLQYHSLLVI